MTWNKKRLGVACGGLIFVLGSAWVHFEVKARLEPATLLLGSGSSESRTGDFRLGDQLVDFSTVDLHGEMVTLTEFQDREVVVLDFWATWCGPCIDGMPDLQELHEEFDHRGVEILAVNVGEQVDTVQKFMAKQLYSFRVIMDPDREIKALYGVEGIPQLIVVDKKGRLRHTEVGIPVSEKGIKNRKKHLKRLLRHLIE